MKHLNLWQRIAAFSIDDPGSSFKFSDRLARENDWSQTYALRVIEEYKRFIYLCAISENPITPSDPVDQAWHLHLTYTESYWVDLCRETLGKEIHHGPTKGGKKEGDKFKDWYGLTFQLYKEEFGETPPEDIWWDSERRFKEIHFTRVNRARSWVISKPGIESRRNVTLTILAIVAFGLFSYAINGFGVFMAIVLVLLLIRVFGGRGGGKGGGKGGAGGGLGGWFGCGSGGGSSGCSSGCGGGGCGGGCGGH